MLVEVQVRSVEEEHLADAGFERIDVERRERRVAVALRNGELQLDRVGPLDQSKEIPKLVAR
ncbi:MAG TPA: hypothetical protein VFD47_01185 [Actinomycetota bacterium]|nr:hypothetical protein [Actinomycetota bacterium]